MTDASKEEQLQGRYDFIVVGAGAAGFRPGGRVVRCRCASARHRVGRPRRCTNGRKPEPLVLQRRRAARLQPSRHAVSAIEHRPLNIALGHVVGGGSSINAMVWTRGMQRDYDGWETNGAKGWAFADVLPIFKAQENWEAGANSWRGANGPIHIRRPRVPHPTGPRFSRGCSPDGHGHP